MHLFYSFKQKCDFFKVCEVCADILEESAPIFMVCASILEEYTTVLTKMQFFKVSEVCADILEESAPIFVVCASILERCAIVLNESVNFLRLVKFVQIF